MGRGGTLWRETSSSRFRKGAGRPAEARFGACPWKNRCPGNGRTPPAEAGRHVPKARRVRPSRAADCRCRERSGGKHGTLRIGLSGLRVRRGAYAGKGRSGIPADPSLEPVLSAGPSGTASSGVLRPFPSVGRTEPSRIPAVRAALPFLRSSFPSSPDGRAVAVPFRPAKGGPRSARMPLSRCASGR